MDEEIKSTIQDEFKTVLDSQLSNLSERLFEVGRRADQQLTAWLMFASLTILLCFGVADAVSLGGIRLQATVASAVTYGLSCAFYYRAVLSMAALETWRESLRERRNLRFATLIGYAEKQGPETLEETIKDVNAFVSEYPGYLACSVLVKHEAEDKGGVSGAFIATIHKSIILVFTLAPYILAFALIYRSQYSLVYIVIAGLGLAVCFSANVIIRLEKNA
jgi:hypothetical protein